jgi:hypothetical protein
MRTTTRTLSTPRADLTGIRPVWLVGAVAGLAAAAATELYGLAARAAGVPMSAGNVGGTTAEPITVGMFAMGTVICTFWGTVLAVLPVPRRRPPRSCWRWPTWSRRRS